MTPDEEAAATYLQRAEEAMRMAASADTAEERATFRQIAETWLMLAQSKIPNRSGKTPTS